MNSPSSGKTWLYLVRHGATDANEQRPYVLQGANLDHSLSDTGRRQAGYVADFLSDFSVDAIYVSHLKRAVETAQTIAQQHGLAVNQREELREVDVGEWEGMNWEDIMSQHPGEYERFMHDPGRNPYLGGETYTDVLERVRPVISDLLEQHAGESIVVVAHNVVNRVILADLLRLDIGKSKDIKQSNACVNVIQRSNGETALVTMNANFHLPEELR